LSSLHIDYSTATKRPAHTCLSFVECLPCTNYASKGVALHLHASCYFCMTGGFMCYVMLKHMSLWKRKDHAFRCQFCEKRSIIPGCPGHVTLHYRPCRCTLCSGTGAVGWEGKWNHKEPCPMCLGKRFVDCPECGGHFHRRIFNHHHHKGLTVTELVEAEQGTFAKLGD